MVLSSVILVSLGVPLLALLVMVVYGMLVRPPAAETPPPVQSWPSVTVIIPAHDEEARLPATLASLARQRYSGACTFVIVDDRSTDGTTAVIEGFVASDPRFRLERVRVPSRRYAPKVNAVLHGIEASDGEVIVTSDADCQYPQGWLEGMVSYLQGDVVMVAGYVETILPPHAGPVAWFEALDWFSLMLTSRSLLRLGGNFASSANNQAYLRSAFLQAGGFGAAARAPSGDEDLLTQRLGRIPGGRVVFGSAPAVRVQTRATGSLSAFLRQRRRWLSRYQHLVQYHPGFIAGLCVLGFESIALSLALLASPFVPAILPVALCLYGAQTLVHVTGMTIGGRQLARPAFGGLRALGWALLHPFFIATVLVLSFLRPNAWWAGAGRYRRNLLRHYLRLMRRRWTVRG